MVLVAVLLSLLGLLSVEMGQRPAVAQLEFFVLEAAILVLACWVASTFLQYQC